MKKKLIFGFLFLWSFVIPLVAEDLRNAQFTQVVESVKEGILAEAAVWMKNGQVRIEYQQEQEPMVMLLIDGMIYNYLPNYQMATKVPMEGNFPTDQLKPEMIQSPTKLKTFLNEMGAKVLEQEKVDGYRCDVYQFQEPESQALVTMWIDQKLFFLSSRIFD